MVGNVIRIKMQSKGNQPNASQKRWMATVRAYGSVVSGGPAVVHHCVGRTGKHKKRKIGHEFLIPLTDEEHKALHLGETFGYESRKEFEKTHFAEIYALHRGCPDTPSDDCFWAIMDYSI